MTGRLSAPGQQGFRVIRRERRVRKAVHAGLRGDFRWRVNDEANRCARSIVGHIMCWRDENQDKTSRHLIGMCSSKRAMPWDGATVYPAMEYAFVNLEFVLAGAIIAAAYWSAVAVRFEAKA